MRRLPQIAMAVLTLAAGAETFAQPEDEDAGPVDRCEATDCFNQTRIRNVEVIDQTTLIVYVGRQECPFLVELTGTFCDLTFLPSFDVVFRPSRRIRDVIEGNGFREDGAERRITPIVGGPNSATDPFTNASVEQPRVCANDISLGIEYDPFTAAGGVEEDATGLACRLQNVRSLTDDERLQVYVDNAMAAPPPPFGTGRVEAPEDAQEVSEEGSETSAAEPADERPRRRRRRDDE